MWLVGGLFKKCTSKKSFRFASRFTIMNHNEKLKELEARLTGDMMKDMEIRQEMMDIIRDRDGIVCNTSGDNECLSCGS